MRQWHLQGALPIFTATIAHALDMWACLRAIILHHWSHKVALSSKKLDKLSLVVIVVLDYVVYLGCHGCFDEDDVLRYFRVLRCRTVIT
jgi:hypothetical protein